MHTCTCHTCTLTLKVEIQQASVSLLWECETSLSHSLVPGGNGTEHCANQLQLSPPGLKVSPPTGMIYSQVERQNRSLSLCFSSSWAGWLARGSWLAETKIMIHKTNPHYCFLLFAIYKVTEVADCRR